MAAAVPETKPSSRPSPRDPGQSLGLSDQEVIARVLSGEGWCFEILMRRYNLRVFRAVRAILKRDDLAEDVMQDAYVRAYEHLLDFRGESAFSTWLTRIAVHEALARVRQERRFQLTEPTVEEPPPMSFDSRQSPEQLVTDRELRVVLERAIDALPEDFRAVFMLRAVEQMSGQETAACLGIAEETVKTRLYRARLRLQEIVVGSLESNYERAYEFHLSRCDRVVSGVLERLAIRTPALLPAR